MTSCSIIHHSQLTSLYFSFS